MIIILLNYILVVICTLLVIIPTWKLIKAVIKRKKDGSEPGEWSFNSGNDLQYACSCNYG